MFTLRLKPIMACLHSIFLLPLIVLMIILASVNCQGIRSPDRRKLAFSFFKRNRFDIILLQETHFTADMEIQVKREWEGDVCFTHGTNSARGVAILISSRLDHNIIQTRRDNEGRILNILLQMEEHAINIVNVYAPSTDTDRRIFFSDLGLFLSHDYYNVIGGDFNCIMDIRQDKLGGNRDARQSASGFLHTINARYNLTDVWRERHKGERDYTWTGRNSADNSFIRTRIDFFLACRTLNQFVTSAEIQPYAYSDHDCIRLTLDFDEIQRGPGYWHFNNELLTDALFEAEIEEFWTNWQQKFEEFPDPLQWWEKAKQSFKTIAIKRAKIRRKVLRHERYQLESKMERLHELAKNGTVRDIERYLLAKENLKQLDLKELDSTKIRTKAQFIEQGEKSTRYFFSLEKSRRADQTIRVLTKDNLVDTVTETQGLLSETYAFYKDLYSAQVCEEDAQESFLSDGIPRLSADSRELCEGNITEEELRQAVTSMENDKSPGIDGLTTNFYKHFWPLLGNSLTRVYNYAFHIGHLSVSQRRGVISLLFKKGDRTLLKNWRPITLLTTDYKILTKALANRLQKVLPSIVHTDQTASIKGRTINDNTRLLHDVISYANENNIPLAVISVDQLKAFDRVAHQFLFKTLERFGFGPSFIHWIQVIYTSVSSSVKTNGWLTAFINLERGLRQGCPLSMPLYVLTAETMAINIRNNSNIHGLRPPDSETELKLSQFADDTTLLLTDESSITETFNVFDRYERASGAKINKGKCKGLWSGGFSHRTDQLYGFSWYNDYIPDKVLGQYFGNVDCTQRNWDAKIQRINNIIGAWRHRELSFKGRALLINSLLTSTLWYNVTSLSVPSWVISQIEQAVYGFFWNYKHPLVNRDILALPLKEGGFNLPRLETRIRAFRLNTLKRFLSAEDAHWKRFTAHFLRVAKMPLGKMTLLLDYSLQRIDPDIPAFYKELLTAWNKHGEHRIRIQTPESATDILNEPLFLNDLITTQNKPLFFKEWIAAGLTQIKDICYEVVPGYLPAQAIHEILTDQNSRTLSRTAQELGELLDAIPPHWSQQICTHLTLSPPTIQPCFGIINPRPGQPPTDILSCKTRDFYNHLQQAQKPALAAIDYWKQAIQPEPLFNAQQWRTLYSPLVTNKQGDINWKIVHRVLPTALSLNRMGVYASASCHRCGMVDTIEHALLECPPIVNFWNYVQTFVNKISNSNLSLTAALKLFGKVSKEDDPFSKRHADIINWTLTIARYAIHKSAVYHRVHKETIPPEAIFGSVIKAHLRFQFQLYSITHRQYYFPHHWCLGQAFAKIENEKLVFTF